MDLQNMYYNKTGVQDRIYRQKTKADLRLTPGEHHRGRMLFSRSSSACGGVACLRVVMIAQYFKAIWMQSLFHLPILTNNGHTVSFRPLLSDSYFMITKWSIKMNKNRLMTAALRCTLLIFEGAMCNSWLYTLKDVMTLFKIVYSYICVINLAMS